MRFATSLPAVRTSARSTATDAPHRLAACDRADAAEAVVRPVNTARHETTTSAIPRRIVPSPVEPERARERCHPAISQVKPIEVSVPRVGRADPGRVTFARRIPCRTTRLPGRWGPDAPRRSPARAVRRPRRPGDARARIRHDRRRRADRAHRRTRSLHGTGPSAGHRAGSRLGHVPARACGGRTVHAHRHGLDAGRRLARGVGHRLVGRRRVVPPGEGGRRGRRRSSATRSRSRSTTPRRSSRSPCRRPRSARTATGSRTGRSSPCSSPSPRRSSSTSSTRAGKVVHPPEPRPSPRRGSAPVRLGRAWCNKGGHWVRADDGVFTVTASAVDDAGNPGTAAPAPLRVDTQAPGFKWGSASSPNPPPAAARSRWRSSRSIRARRSASRRPSGTPSSGCRSSPGVTKPTGAASVQISAARVAAARPVPGPHRAHRPGGEHDRSRRSCPSASSTR